MVYVQLLLPLPAQLCVLGEAIFFVTIVHTMNEKRRFRRWAFWRRFQYSTGFLAVFGMSSTLIYFVFFYTASNCFDGIMNGTETAIDAGGVCVRIDPATVIQPSLVWAKSFEVAEGQYNAVAYVENSNQTAATPVLEYTFELLNNGVVVAERSGVTVLPPNSSYPIFEGRIFTDGKVPVTETRLVLSPSQDWRPASIGRDQFRSLDIQLVGAGTRPRLKVEIENTQITSAENVEVVATIFNTFGEAVTASQTYIEDFSPRSTQDIIFTWPNPLLRAVKSCIIPTDVLLGIDLSGSMNNDGGDPPQPISDALEAASTFVNSLQEQDQVGVVTFATNGSLVTQLTDSYDSVTDSVLALNIQPSEESGYTNTVQALELVRAELASLRHNPDARRVLVLLTDGLPTTKGDADVIAAAETIAKELGDAGVEVYVIGLGANADAQFIQNIASENSNAYFAPDGADLANIYAEITSSLCEAGEGKIEVIAKTKTNFAPLR
jgi:Mg-chelatase subunit ChlD